MFLMDSFLFLIFCRKSGIKWSEFSNVEAVVPQNSACLLYMVELRDEVFVYI